MSTLPRWIHTLLVVVTGTKPVLKGTTALRRANVGTPLLIQGLKLSLGSFTNLCLDVSSCQKTDYLSGPVSKRQTAGSTFTPITGIPQKVVERRPIAVLQNSYPDVFNMFILALESLQARQESNDTSYYQVSGKTYIKPRTQTRSTTHAPVRDSWISIYSMAIWPRKDRQSWYGLLHPRQCYFHHMASAVSGSDRGMTLCCEITSCSSTFIADT